MWTPYEAINRNLAGQERIEQYINSAQFFFLFVVDFVILWNETAMGLHVFPIPIPPPTSLSTHSL